MHAARRDSGRKYPLDRRKIGHQDHSPATKAIQLKTDLHLKMGLPD
jgi:hypothetical protein